MAGQPNLNDGNFKDLDRRLRKLEAGAPMNNAAIGRSGMEVYDGGTINVSSGTLLVNGLASITGTFRVAGGSTFTGQVAISGPLTISGATGVTGPFTVTGDTTLNGQTDIGGNTSVTGDLDVKGPLTVTGVTKLDGKTDIGGNTTVDGTLDIKGKSTLQNDLTVQGGGKVKVGSMTLDPSVGSGSMKFANGGQVYSNGGTIQVFKGTSVVQVEDGKASLMGDGSNYVIADSSGVRVGGGFRVLSPAAAPSDAKANVYMDASGNIRRING